MQSPSSPSPLFATQPMASHQANAGQEAMDVIPKVLANAFLCRKAGNNGPWSQTLMFMRSGIESSSTLCTAWYNALCEHVSSIGTEDDELLNIALGSYSWLGGDECFQAFGKFVHTLVSFNNAFLRTVYGVVVGHFMPVQCAFQRTTSKASVQVNGKSTPDDALTLNFDNAATRLVGDRVAVMLQSLLRECPSSMALLYDMLESMYPHSASPRDVHSMYVQCCLRVSLFCPPLEKRILHLIVRHMIELDAAIRLDDKCLSDEGHLFHMDNDDMVERMQVSAVADRLDVCMYLLFSYFASRSISTDDTSFDALMSVFETVILNTYKSKYTQFLMFFAIAQSPMTYGTRFLGFLINKLFETQSAAFRRQTCAGYLGSFCARFKNLPVNLLNHVFKVLLDWAHAYAIDISPAKRSPDAEMHGLFYVVSQCICYIYCFKHEQLHWEALPAFATQMDCILRCCLNPFKFFIAEVVEEFVRISRRLSHLQLDDLVERNRHVVLPTHCHPNLVDQVFPFDPYLLRHSHAFVSPHYLAWSDVDIPEEDSDDDGDESDDSGVGEDEEDVEGVSSYKRSLPFAIPRSNSQSSEVLRGLSAMSVSAPDGSSLVDSVGMSPGGIKYVC